MTMTVMTMTTEVATRWEPICGFERLEAERGVAALVDGVQIAIFRTFDDELFAIANRDPVSGAQVMSRGIVGTRADAPTVASPLHKQVYDLRTGVCLDTPDVRVTTYPVRRHGDTVEVGLFEADR
jgi:nitrite reductase (NADH) small subunit